MQNLTRLLPGPRPRPTHARPYWRPKLHFAPLAHWANDPNALLFDGERFRLLFQYRDDAPDYRERCVWASASSEDLAHWQFEGIALDAGHERAGYSGCVVDDPTRPNELQAFWTEHRATPPVPQQRIRSANSGDGGRTFALDSHPSISRDSANFRDPFVFWHAASARWIMLVAEPCDWSTTEGHQRSCLHVYHSAERQRWIWVSQIGPWDAPSIMWEVPQLVSFNVDSQETWCLIISTVDRADDASWCSVRYRFGDFDGKRFEPHDRQDTWWTSNRRVGGTPLDYGPDFYAAVISASNAAGSGDSPRTRAIAWMSNWRDARALPWPDFAGGPMTSPRDLDVFVDAKGSPRIRQLPAAAIWQSGGRLIFAADSIRLGSSMTELAVLTSLCFVVAATFDVPPAASCIELLLVGTGDDGAAAVPWKLTINDADVLLERDSATDEWTRGGPTRAAVAPRNHRVPIKIMILIDQCTSEVFIDGGEAVITSLFFPQHQGHKLCARYSRVGARAGHEPAAEIEARAVSIRAVE
jgi:fructan beta-fructosidase